VAFSTLLRGLVRALTGRPARAEEVDIHTTRGIRVAYSPSPGGTADGGEIVWTWVPFQENPGQGKDRPVLVIGRAGRGHAWAMKLTSKAHAGDREYVSLGSGAWDASRRESWLDLDQLYRVPDAAVRREAAALDARTFRRVAAELQRRYGWRI
jgi:PemK-like, MazF-like toxin of type II toxin-antitoxin system